jgi:hypothetical protein
VGLGFFSAAQPPQSTAERHALLTRLGYDVAANPSPQETSRHLQ